jgi:aspartate/methionine/tyrosine aminotransferase
MPELAKLARTYRRSTIRQVFDAAAGRDDLIRLEIGEPNFDTPLHVVTAAAEAAALGATHYPPTGGIPELRSALADRLASRHGYRPDPDDIVVTAGGTPAIFSLFTCLLGAGDEALIPTPGFPNMDEMVRVLDAAPVFYHLTAAGQYLPDLDQLAGLVGPRTRVLFVNTPANPTGSVYPAELMRALVRFASERDIWLISDEVYDALVLDPGIRHYAAAPFDHDGHVLSVYSFSKVYAMTGWRLGYCVAPPPVAERLRTLELHGSYASSVAQAAGLAALCGPQEPFEAMRAAYSRRRDLAWAAVHAHGLAAVRPQGAMYLFIDVSRAGITSMEFTLRLLEEERVTVAPGSVFGPAGEGHVRLSFAASEEAITAGIERIAAALRRWAPEAAP